MPASKPIVLGITGGIGCGKSEAAAYLESLGAVHIDADAISRELTAPGGAALGDIRRQFGDEVFNDDGTLNRIRMGAIVFGSEPHRHALEGILHPMVQAETLRRLRQAEDSGAQVVVLNVPLLFETGMDVLCDETWTLTTDPETQLVRVMARGFSEEEARARIASQMKPDERAERAKRVIRTDRPMEKTRQELSALYQQLLKKRA